jgi:hypothetical protein
MRDVRTRRENGVFAAYPKNALIKAELHNFSGICPCLWKKGRSDLCYTSSTDFYGGAQVGSCCVRVDTAVALKTDVGLRNAVSSH